MIIRRARLSDYEGLIPLLNDFVGDDRYSRRDNDSFAKMLRDSRSFVFVAKEKKRLIGFVTFCVRKVVRYSKPIMEIDEMYVSPDFRRKGVGKSLLKLAEKKAKELGCRKMFLESHEDRKGAHKFYASMGYKKGGYYFDKIL